MAPPLKVLVDGAAVRRVAARVAAVLPGFDEVGCAGDLDDVLPGLALKARIAAIADRVRDGLPGDVAAAIGIIVEAAERESPELRDFDAWVWCAVVERFGLEAPSAALDAMPRLTGYWSCEFAIRPFLRHHLEATFARFPAWVDSDDPAVRRLVSEGTRPHLPWAMQVPALLANPQRMLPLLTRLRDDPDEAVRRSVANHLNDISRDHPSLVEDIANTWMAGATEPRRRLVSHALRTLVKRGRPGALAVLGFTTEPRVRVDDFTCSSAVALGSHLDLAVTLVSDSTAPQKLVVDFVIRWLKAHDRVSPQVFKWETVSLAPGAMVTLKKRFPIRPATTRRYQPGRHEVVLQVAGEPLATLAFDLSV